MELGIEDQTEKLQRVNLNSFNFTQFPESEDPKNHKDSEDENDYCEGGHHPVKSGETFKKGRYVVVQKLGRGHFSTVWLCLDITNESYCAIKVHKAGEQYREAARDEIKLLNVLKKRSKQFKDKNVVELLDYFKIEGPNGYHYCLTFEVLSSSILSLIRKFNYKGFPISMVRVISRQILEGLHYIHDKCQIIHTDLKPENILFVHCKESKEYLTGAARRAVGEITQKSDFDEYADTSGITVSSFAEANPDLAFASKEIKLVDFGNACRTTKHYSEHIQTRQYRAPEVILGNGYDQKADMWSVACLVFEMATGDFLFDPHSSDDYNRDEDHVASMMELLGPIPYHIREKGRHTQDYMNKNGDLLNIKQLNFWSLQDILREKYKFSSEDAEILNNFMMPMLQFDPQERASAKKQLKHSFVNDLGEESSQEKDHAPLKHKSEAGAIGPAEAFEMEGSPIRSDNSVNVTTKKTMGPGESLQIPRG